MRILVAALGTVLILTGCTAAPTAAPGDTASATPTPTVSGVQPAGDPTVIATGLASPWSILRIGDDVTLVSERDTGVIERVTASGGLTPIGTVPGVVHTGEGGLLGLASRDDWLYASTTTADDNRIIRMPLRQDTDHNLGLGEPQIVLAGLAKATNHDGGRLAFGPDGLLYATVGDAGQPDRAQSMDSLNGKILRMTPTGQVPADNPFPGSLIYTLGHRNPQGLAWDASGQLFAAEFGQNSWDEFNKVVAGSNYGWPVVEGQSHDPRFVDPLVQWPTSDASPSGLAYVDGTFFLAALRGQRLWAIDVAADGTATARPFYVQQFGRLRDVTPGPDGSLLLLTGNTDGRGQPKPGDDRLLRVPLTPLAVS